MVIPTASPPSAADTAVNFVNMDLLPRENVTAGVAGIEIPFSRGIWMSISAFTAVAWYNIFELNVQVFLTFKRHRGLYFWSLLISGYGCILHALGFLLKFFQLTSNPYVYVTIVSIGWYAMVTGQAVVLYSRLHLVVREQRILRAVLAMIIVDAICFHIPTTVLTYGTNSYHNVRINEWTKGFNVVEKLQMTAFCIQEFIISGIYVWSTVRLLRPVYHGRTRKVMMQLIWINLIIIMMDVCLLALEYANQYVIEAAMKGMVYSIKLKLEFSVLNQLMTLANSSVNAHQSLQVEDAEKPTKPRPGRSRSTEYISSTYAKREKWDKSRGEQEETPTKPDTTIRKHPQPTRHSSHGAYGSPSKANFPFMASLDRHMTVETKHIENAKKARTASEPELNEINNPAAHFNTIRRAPHHDKYGYVFDEEDEEEGEEPMTSPALTGTTIRPPSPRISFQSPRPPSQLSPSRTEPGPVSIHSSGRRRAPPPPNLSLHYQQHYIMPPVMPNGLVRSTRPSVSEWGRGPDCETSPGSDEVQLNPYETTKPLPQSPGSVRAARERASKRRTTTPTMGMDFVTSALRPE